MSKTATILFALCTLFCSACSWVDDDQSDCPTGCWLKLSYTYNMLNVDAVTTQVKDVTLFILDQEGNYIDREEVDTVTSFELRRHIIQYIHHGSGIPAYTAAPEIG